MPVQCATLETVELTCLPRVLFLSHRNFILSKAYTANSISFSMHINISKVYLNKQTLYVE